MKTMSDKKWNIEQELGLSPLGTKLVLALLAGQGGRLNKFVSSSRLAFLLGGSGKWSDYRHKTMEILSHNNIIVFMRVSEEKKRTWYYSFTDQAAEHIGEIMGWKS